MGADQPNPVSTDEEFVGMARAGYERRASMLDQEPTSGVLGAVDHAMNISANGALARLRTTAWARSQAVRLEHGLATQSAPDFGGQNYPGYATAVLHKMVTTNINPGAIGAAGAAYNSVGNTYARIAQDLGSAASSSESGWVGAAGDSARAFLAGMAKWADTTAQGAQLAGNQLGMQAEAAQTAMHSMPTPVEPPTAAAVRQAMLRTPLNPAAGAAQLDQQFQAAQQTHAEAVRVVETYDANLAAVGNTMPAFDPPPPFNPTAGSGTNGAVGSAGIPGMGTHGAQSPQAGGADHVGPAPVLAGSASQTSPPTQLGPSAQPGGQQPAMTPPSAPIPPSSPPADSTMSPSAAGMSQVAGGMNLPGGQVGGASLFESPGAPGEPLAGGRSVGAPEVSGGHAAGVNEVVERPMSGGGSMPGLIGGRGGRGEIDKEHKRPSYLENPDPDATFGTDQIVAPPVIGA